MWKTPFCMSNEQFGPMAVLRQRWFSRCSLREAGRAKAVAGRRVGA